MAEAPPWLINLAKSMGYNAPAETRGVSTAAVLAYLFVNKGRDRTGRAGNLRQAILRAQIDLDEVTEAYAFVTELETEKPLPLRLWALEERTTDELVEMFERGPGEWRRQIPHTFQDTLKEFLESDPAFLQQLEEVITGMEERGVVFDALWQQKRDAMRSPVEDCVYYYNRLVKRLPHSECVAIIEERRQEKAVLIKPVVGARSLKQDAATLYHLFVRLKPWQQRVLILGLVVIAAILYLVS